MSAHVTVWNGLSDWMVRLAGEDDWHRIDNRTAEGFRLQVTAGIVQSLPLDALIGVFPFDGTRPRYVRAYMIEEAKSLNPDDIETSEGWSA